MHRRVLTSQCWLNGLVMFFLYLSLHRGVLCATKCEQICAQPAALGLPRHLALCVPYSRVPGMLIGWLCLSNFEHPLKPTRGSRSALSAMSVWAMLGRTDSSSYADKLWAFEQDGSGLTTGLGQPACVPLQGLLPLEGQGFAHVVMDQPPLQILQVYDLPMSVTGLHKFLTHPASRSRAHNSAANKGVSRQCTLTAFVAAWIF